MDSSGEEERPPPPPVRNASAKDFDNKPLPNVPQLDSEKKNKKMSFKLFPVCKYPIFLILNTLNQILL